MGSGSGPRRREVIGAIALVAVLAAGALVLLHRGGGEDPGLGSGGATSADGPGPPNPPLPQPGPVTAQAPSTARLRPPVSTATAETPPDRTGGGPDAAVTGPPRGKPGRLQIELRLPDRIMPPKRRSVEVIIPSERGPTRVLQLAVIVDDGRWRVDVGPIAPGPLRFYIDAQGCSGGPFEVTVPAGDAVRAGPLALEPEGRLQVRASVSSGYSGPVEFTGSLWSLDDAAGSRARTRSGLRPPHLFDIGGVPAGRYALRLFCPGHAVTTRRDIRVGAGATCQVDVVMPPEARIPLRITGPAGDPPGSLYLILGLPGGTTLRRLPQAERRHSFREISVVGGQIALRELPAGRVTVSASRSPSGPFAEIGVLNLEPGDNAPATFTWRD